MAVGKCLLSGISAMARGRRLHIDKVLGTKLVKMIYATGRYANLGMVVEAC